MIPTIATICEDLKAGKITVQQAIEWLYMHAKGAANDLRDGFAMTALQGMLASETAGSPRQFPVTARVAYAIADAMLAEREHINGR